MPIATGLALGLGAMSMAGGIGSAAIGANAAGNAANAQVAAANHAADLQYKSSQQALDFQKQMWGTQQSNMAPWLQTGGQAENTLAQLMGLPGYQQQQQMTGGAPPSAPGFAPAPGGPMRSIQGGPAGPGGYGAPGGPLQMGGARTSPGGPLTLGGSLGGSPNNTNLVPLGPWTEQFQAPTEVTEKNDPGYQFRMDQGLQALDRSAAANGTLLSGAGIKPYERYAQDYASNEYGNVYNRAFGEYANRYNVFQNNQTNEWNRYAALAGLGQTSASQLNATGSGVAGNYANILGNYANQVGQDYNNAGAARASGYVGAGNAWSSALSGGTNSLMDMILLSQMNGQNGSGGGGGNSF